MTENDIRALNYARQFLARVELTGQEVPAYVEVMNWLNELSKTPTPGDERIDKD